MKVEVKEVEEKFEMDDKSCAELYIKLDKHVINRNLKQ